MVAASRALRSFIVLSIKKQRCAAVPLPNPVGGPSIQFTEVQAAFQIAVLYDSHNSVASLSARIAFLLEKQPTPSCVVTGGVRPSSAAPSQTTSET
jgi:hypothetical protein